MFEYIRCLILHGIPVFVCLLSCIDDPLWTAASHNGGRTTMTGRVCSVSSQRKTRELVQTQSEPGLKDAGKYVYSTNTKPITYCCVHVTPFVYQMTRLNILSVGLVLREGVGALPLLEVT